MKHHQVHFLPDNLAANIHEGATLLEAAGQVGIILSTPCGGIGRCFKCHVDIGPSEKAVLACQYIVKSDLTVVIPEKSRFFRQQILEHGIQREITSDPFFKKVYLRSFNGNSDQLAEAISEQIPDVEISLSTKDDIISLLGNMDSNGLTVTLKSTNEIQTLSSNRSYELIAVEPGNTSSQLYGLAIDIGTTTVVARLINLNSGEILNVNSLGNPQSRYGSDVISRINYSQEQNGSEHLQQTILSSLDQLINQAVQKAEIDRNAIYDVVIVGNTAMNHLLRKLPVAQLGQAPYRAHSLDASDLAPSESGLNIYQNGNTHFMANIAGFVGSDTLAAALACGMDLSDVNAVLVDIGTNGEIALKTQSHLLAASCAAGPALEGAGIVCGSRAQSGAIERVVYDGDEIGLDIIDSEKAHTICGSGLIDALAVMLELEVIDSTGRFYEPHELNPLLAASIRERLITIENESAFVLAGQLRDNTWKDPVFLKQGDIRQLQLAKAAIRVGIEMLLKKAEITSNHIQQLFLAGAFGNYIQRENAVRIGLLPDIPIKNIHFVGNAAGSGAQMALISRHVRKTAIDFSRQFEYLEIANQPDFQTIFSNFLLFPEK